MRLKLARYTDTNNIFLAFICDGVYRIERGYKFPEAMDKIGLNDELIESELEFFKTTVDGLGGKVKTLCWLFDKTFEDFERIFRANAHRGMEIFE